MSYVLIYKFIDKRYKLKLPNPIKLRIKGYVLIKYSVLLLWCFFKILNTGNLKSFDRLTPCFLPIGVSTIFSLLGLDIRIVQLANFNL